MLKDGIYEQIVNNRINAELASLDLEKYDITLESLSADDARRVLSIYISYVVQQGLRYVREEYKSDQDREALISQIKLCNEIITEVAEYTNESDFEDNKILV